MLTYAAVDAGGPRSVDSPFTGLRPGSRASPSRAADAPSLRACTRPVSHHGVTKDLVVQLPCQSPLIRAFPTGADAHTTQGLVLKFLPLRKRRSLCKTFWWESRCTVPRPDRDACARHLQQLDTPTDRLHAHCPVRFCVTGRHSSQETCFMHQSLHSTSCLSLLTPRGPAPRRFAPMCAQGGPPGRSIKTLWNPSFLAAAQTPGSLCLHASHPRGCSSVIAP